MKLERVAGDCSESLAGFVGIRSSASSLRAGLIE
jgi:hypothetical protein